MNLKATTLTLLAFLCLSRLYAAEYSFTPDRVSSITLVTTTGKEHVSVTTWIKQTDSDKTIFESRLIPVESPSGDPSYKTPKGTVFTLKKLPQPVINDANRNINSGDWKLKITGTGAEYARLKKDMPTVTFGKTPPLVYLGSRPE